MSEFNQARREGKVKFGYDFSTLAEVMQLWGLSATMPKANDPFMIPGRKNAICIFLDEDGDNGWRDIMRRHNQPCFGMKTDGRGWNEIVRIVEFNFDSRLSALRVENELREQFERYAFRRESRNGAAWYKFYGVFKLDVAETLASKEKGMNECIYRKISDEGECPKCEVQPRTVSADEFQSCEGKILAANFLDEFPYEVADRKQHVGNINAWPGQKFLVKNVSPSALTAVCVTDDRNVLSQVRYRGEVCFTIPKRDIELGHFSILDKGALDDTVVQERENSELVAAIEEDVVTSAEFDASWEEFVNW